jgi:rubredoxin/mono/diheme cytochrome c family protein
MMARYECTVCGFIHDEAKEEAWNSLPGDWTCPVCGAGKSDFKQLEATGEQETAASPPSATASPSPAILAHRVFGYVFLAIYVVLMLQMIPRLWTYQIEFPARTVVHLSLGMAVGVMLLLKISIVRFFRRLDQALVPMLGSGILVSSVVLIGISVPAAFREAMATSRLFTDENRERVSLLLAQTDLDAAECERFTTAESLRQGQQILRRQCIECHDLRTVLARPRTPSNWRQTVSRMADRAELYKPLSEDDQWMVTAYLVALSPQLQVSRQLQSDQQDQSEKAKQAAAAATQEPAKEASYDPAAAQALFEAKCSQCHRTKLVNSATLATEEDSRELVGRMVDEGLEASEAELIQIVRYLTETHVKPE